MIWKQWTEKYLPQCNVRAKCNQRAKHPLIVGDLIWLIDESVKKRSHKMARVM